MAGFARINDYSPELMLRLLDQLNFLLSSTEYAPKGCGLDDAQWTQLREFCPLRSLGPVRLVEGMTPENETGLLDYLVLELP